MTSYCVKFLKIIKLIQKTEKSTARVKPNILEKDRERLLAKIATKGVVQLFNAVRNQQKTFEAELSKDLPEGKKEKILKKFDKRAFLDTLMGQSKSIIVDEQTKNMKDEVKGEEKPRWNALRLLTICIYFISFFFYNMPTFSYSKNTNTPQFSIYCHKNKFL